MHLYASAMEQGYPPSGLQSFSSLLRYSSALITMENSGEVPANRRLQTRWTRVCGHSHDYIRVQQAVCPPIPLLDFHSHVPGTIQGWETTVCKTHRNPCLSSQSPSEERQTSENFTTHPLVLSALDKTKAGQGRPLEGDI